MGKIRFAAVGLFSGALALSLAGCSTGAHQVVESEGECVSCHSESHEFFDVASPAGAESVASTVEVATNADKVTVCEPLFTSADASYFVPLAQTVVSAQDGKATVELGSGTWVLAIDNGESAISKLVTVADGGAASIELK